MLMKDDESESEMLTFFKEKRESNKRFCHNRKHCVLNKKKVFKITLFNV